MDRNEEDKRAGKTILVVEDNPAARLALETVLEALGYDVIVAESGEEALQIFPATAQRVDLVMTDLILPGIGGPELCQQLRLRRPDLRCLLMSGYPLDEERERLARYGITEWMQKPFGMQEISAQLRAMLDG